MSRSAQGVIAELGDTIYNSDIQGKRKSLCKHPLPKQQRLL